MESGRGRGKDASSVDTNSRDSTESYHLPGPGIRGLKDIKQNIN